MPVHMRADDVHLVWLGSGDFRAVHLLALTVDRLFAIYLADLRVRLLQQVPIHRRSASATEDGCSTRSRSFERIDWGNRRRIAIRIPCRDIGVRETFDISAAVGLQLRLNPLHRVAIASRPLAAIAEAAQRFNR